MLHHYNDIRSRIPEPPKWFDSNGVPRYCEMEPDASPDIYAREVVFLEIACQGCGQRFNVEMERNPTNEIVLGLPRTSPLSEQIKEDTIHYGDPPRHNREGRGCSGATMNCEDLRILAYWHRPKMDWERAKELEIELPDLQGVKL